MRFSSRLSGRLSQWPCIQLVVLLFVLSACSNGGTGKDLSQAPSGPIQLFDVHDTFLCEIHGQNPQTDCLTPEAPIRQFAAHFLDYAVNELASDLHVQVTKLPSTA